jgi:hypothetical protein
MYKLAPADQPLPGTQLVQRVEGNGLASYYGTPTYFATPAGAAGIRGLGCGGDCGCSDCRSGVAGWGDGGGLLNTGLFSAGLDYTQWGLGEWAAVFTGAYMVFSTFYTTGQATRYARTVPGRARRRAARGAARIIGGK